MARQHGADAVVERIAGREHADLVPRALRQHVLDAALERARPGARLAADQRAASARWRSPPNTIGGARRPDARADRAQAVDAVLADADDGEPAAWCGRRDRARKRHDASPCGFSFSAARPRRGSWPSGSRRAAISTSRLSLAGRTSNPVPHPVPVRVGGFGGAAGARRLSQGRAHRSPDRCHASLRGADVRQCGACRAARARVPLLALRRPAWTAGRRRSLDRGRRHARGRACARRRAAPRLPGARPQRDRAVRGGAAASSIWCAASIRSSRRSRCRTRPTSGRAGRSARRTIARCSPRTTIDVVVSKNSGGAAAYGKIAAARALGIEVIMLRRPALPEVPAVETVDDAVAWLDHARRLPRRAACRRAAAGRGARSRASRPSRR